MKYKLVVLGLISLVLAEIIHYCNTYTHPISRTCYIDAKITSAANNDEMFILEAGDDIYPLVVTHDEFISAKVGDQYSFQGSMIDLKPNIQDDLIFYIGERFFVLLGAGLIIMWVVNESKLKRKAERDEFQAGIMKAITKVPKSSRDKHEADLQEAIDNENYELAAKLRDKKK